MCAPRADSKTANTAPLAQCLPAQPASQTRHRPQPSILGQMAVSWAQTQPAPTRLQRGRSEERRVGKSVDVGGRGMSDKDKAASERLLLPSAGEHEHVMPSCTGKDFTTADRHL